MSHSHASRHRAGGMSSTTLLAGKVAFASAAAAFLARMAVPHLVSAAGAVAPRVWAVARFWLAPPYLFVTVHIIILAIWKLSDHKHFQAQHKDDPWPAVAHQHPPVLAVHGAVEEVKSKEAEFGAYGGHMLEHNSEFSPDSGGHVLEHNSEFSPDSGGHMLEQNSDFSPDSGGHMLEHNSEFSPDSVGGDSCVTTEESDEDASSAPSYSSSVETRRSVVIAPAVQQEREISQQAVDGAGEGDDDDDLDATWNAIIQKTRSTPAAPTTPPQQSPPPRARDPSVGAEEMNRRFDDFIKKNRTSFGRQ
jgi:hypothetical protein